MAGKRGNPAWVKGKSANPQGRPRGQTSLEAFYLNHDSFICHRLRWWKFCLELITPPLGLMSPPRTGAAAARRAGYSPKSARFTASRLWKKPVIREIFREVRDIINSSTIHQDPVSGKRTVVRSSSPKTIVTVRKVI